jgi:hypothetical protein
MSNQAHKPEPMEEYLTRRFLTYSHIPNRWVLHEYDNSGHTHGFVLVKDKEGLFVIKTYEVSGYCDGVVVMKDRLNGSINDLLRIVECFEPTNKDFEY